jgi:hypothetical protein
LSALLLGLSLFSKEEGIGTCAYLAAYALFVDPKGWLSGSLAILPHGAVVVGWRALRAAWGYGVENVGVYIDPLTDPLPFATALPERVPYILFGQWSPIPAEAAGLLRPPYSSLIWWPAVVLIGILFLTVAPLLKRDRVARFWTAGMLFATIPVCATLPMDRLLTFVGIGAFGLLAQFWAFVFDRSAYASASSWWRFLATPLAWFFVAVHAVGAPLALPFRANNPLAPRWIEHRLYVQAPLGPGITQKTVVIVNAPSVAHAGYLIFHRLADGKPVPQHTRVLAPAVPAVTIRRLDERTLVIKPAWGYLQFVLDRVFRCERRPLALGEQVRLTGMTATVTALTPDNRPATATFRFDEPLESPSFVWLCYRGTGFEPFVLPAVGEEIEIRFDWRAVFTPPALGANEIGLR